MPNLYSQTLPADSPDRKRPPRMHKGNPPSADQSPVTLALLQLPEERWTLSLLQTRIGTPGRRLDKGPEPSSDDWWNLKLWAEGRARHKANYWTSWSPTERRLTARADTKALAARETLMRTAVAALQLLTAQNTGYVTDVSLVRARCDAAGVVTAETDPMFYELFEATRMRQTGMSQTPPRVFAQADRPALQAMGKLINTERLPDQRWSMVPDELTGGFSLVAK